MTPGVLSLVIPVADEPRNESLPIALWSASQYAPWLSPVLVGSPDLELRYLQKYPGARAIPYLQQMPGKPVRNTSTMLRLACLDPVVTDPFVWSGDDIFFRRDVEVDDVLIQGATALGHLSRHVRTSIYGKLYRTAEDKLRAVGLPTFDYERHVPLLIHKREMLGALDLAWEAPRSAYQNARLERPAYVAEDVKAFHIPDLAALEAEDVPFFSIGARFPLAPVRALLGA